MKYLKKYLSDGVMLMHTSTVCFIIFPLLAIITDHSKFVEDMYFIILFIGTLHSLLAARLVLSKDHQKGIALGLILSGLGLFNGILFLLNIIDNETAGNVVIYELIIITIILWGIFLVKSLRY